MTSLSSFSPSRCRSVPTSSPSASVAITAHHVDPAVCLRRRNPASVYHGSLSWIVWGIIARLSCDPIYFAQQSGHSTELYFRPADYVHHEIVTRATLGHTHRNLGIAYGLRQGFFLRAPPSRAGREHGGSWREQREQGGSSK